MLFCQWLNLQVGHKVLSLRKCWRELAHGLVRGEVVKVRRVVELYAARGSVQVNLAGEHCREDTGNGVRLVARQVSLQMATSHIPQLTNPKRSEMSNLEY